ncbi:MAG: hypothetical protein IPL95_12010 [Saprospiraceae bacterium]|nr:hypothetical protein [Saprospiraceae bacterium]
MDGIPNYKDAIKDYNGSLQDVWMEIMMVFAILSMLVLILMEIMSCDHLDLDSDNDGITDLDEAVT